MTRTLMQTLLYAAMCLLAIQASGCDQHLERPKPAATTGIRNSSTSETSYPAYLARFQKRKKRLNDAGARELLFQALNEQIPQYWTGTPWDFNGTTRTPKSGSIACGYFVTNVLSDLGFKIPRVKLAQQASSVMIRQLTTNIHSFASRTAMEQFIARQGEHDIFIVGLDFHTGIILKDRNRLYFLHANYIKRQGVVKELTSQSAALNASHSFYLGSLYQHAQLISTWLAK